MTESYRMYPRKAFYNLSAFLLIFNLLGCHMTNSSDHNSTRDEDLPLFDPHVATFKCTAENNPSYDTEADKWFKEALELESPQIFYDDRDYGKIVILNRKSAERNHGKAMLNLASLYVEGKDPKHGAEDALQLVERAMKLKIAAAYDRMATYYMNGTGVNADATRAYAFWQRAALMGNPDALTFLGKKMQYRKDQVNTSGWANYVIGVQMLECAYSQGDGNAAFELSLVHSIPMERDATKNDLDLALNFLHEGVKLGSQECAISLWVEFSHPIDPLKKIVPYLDKARSERYAVLGRALDFDPYRRFPNLDKVLPLPPSDLPPWNGDDATLINAAIGVSHPASTPPSTTAYSERKGRFFLNSEYYLTETTEFAEDVIAPFEGYWQSSALESVPPALYLTSERFDHAAAAYSNQNNSLSSKLIWRHWRTVRHDDGTISPPVVSGRTRVIEPPAIAKACSGSVRCPITGVWQAWMHAEHSMQNIVNQYWRQVWLIEGQRFPNPQQDWMLDVEAGEITWYLMDGTGVDICPA
jgi:hypothetical protein